MLRLPRLASQLEGLVLTDRKILRDTFWTSSENKQAADDPVFRTGFESFSAFRNQAFHYSSGNEGSYARFAFPKIEVELEQRH